MHPDGSSKGTFGQLEEKTDLVVLFLGGEVQDRVTGYRTPGVWGKREIDSIKNGVGWVQIS